MREPTFAVGVLGLALLACGHSPVGNFAPQSVQRDRTQICDDAVEIGPDDREAVGEAGGVRLGVYSYGAKGNIMGVLVGRDVAYYGGTHFLPRSRYVFDVYRVKVGSWDLLPPGLRPSK